jgi:ribosomal protein S18
VDYKDVALLRRFISERGRIKARGATGTCAQHQRDVAIAVKTARELALLPYAVRTAAGESRGARGGDRGPSRRPATNEEGAGGETTEPSPESGDGAGDVDDAASGEVADSPTAASASPA